MPKNVKNKVRLSPHVMPLEYDIHLHPDLENFTFEGLETISLSLTKPTKEIVLHSKEIQIETAKIGDVFAKISYDTKSETAILKFSKPIQAGKIKLVIVFKGILNDKMRGFYRSKYAIAGKEYHMATTQFEATDARRAFPCFDEPAQKAVFHVSLVIPKGKTAISNTLPVSVKEHEAGYEVVKFSPTPKMSTYLLAFIVGDFEHIEKKSKGGVIVRVHTTPGKVHQAQFALDVTVKMLEFYERYFDIKYPLNTLDTIAIPDFTSLAMENWGAITYREIGLLIDPERTSIRNKQMIATVIAHELAHQWFGNLVTMEWWTHLWLNEGFASYISYLAVDHMFPEWDMWTQFSVEDLGVALRLDALHHTHPIEVPVHHPDEIGEIFDEVSYSKGASVIRMLAAYLGEKDFRDGLRYYLKKHSYKNTETVHLWEAFEKISKKPVSKMMHNWTSKSGYPVVKAQLNGSDLYWTQERFFLSPASKQKAKDKTKWEIPVLVEKKKDWLKVNIGESGFYRTSYSHAMLEKLKAPVRNKELSPRDRLGIIRDLFALSEAGTIPTTDALEFLEAYQNEENYTVWVELASGLGRLEQVVAKTPLEAGVNKLILKLFSPLALKLGWDKKKGESHADSLLRPLAIARAGRAGDKKVISEAKNIFLKIQKNQPVNPDVRGATYSIVATHGGMKEYKIFEDMYKKATLHEEKNRIGGALGDFKDVKVLCETLNFAMSSNVRPQDTTSIISSVGANPNGRDIWLKCLKTNWKTLVSRYGDGGHTLGRLVKAISGSAEAKHFKLFKEFFRTHEAPGAKRAIEQVLERLEGNNLWLTRDKKAIEKFLKSS